jgi:hypothetical protein
MNSQKRKALWLGFVGLLLIVLGVKYLPLFLALTTQQSKMNENAVILFFSLDDPCDCMDELTQRAEEQIANWPIERYAGLSLLRIPMDQRRDLEAKYGVYSAPSLLLVDAEDQVLWRQDNLMILDGPFRLETLEAAIAKMGRQ